MFVFPFDKIPQGSKIILYGLGKVGHEYIEQIKATDWCEIVGVSDKKIVLSDYPYLPLAEISATDYDWLVISISRFAVSEQAYTSLIKNGVDKKKILRISKPPVVVEKTVNDPNKLTIVIAEGGGIGDALVGLVLIKKIQSIVENRAIIYFLTKYASFFDRFGTWVEARNMANVNTVGIQADVMLSMSVIPIIQHWDEDKVRHFSKTLYSYFLDCQYMYEELFVKSEFHYRITKYALLLGRGHRIEHTDIHDILHIERRASLSIPIFEEEKACLHQFGLAGKIYVTINREAGHPGLEEVSPKLWPTRCYIELMTLIKKNYGNIVLVLVGHFRNEELLPLVDIDLTGKTTLGQMCAVLRGAALHIGCEGGLVHLMHFLGGRSMVFFGPTDVKVFGYEENINLHTDVCKDHCEWLTNQWQKGCVKGKDEPECLSAIPIEAAFSLFQEAMSIYK